MDPIGSNRVRGSAAKHVCSDPAPAARHSLSWSTPIATCSTKSYQSQLPSPPSPTSANSVPKNRRNRTCCCTNQQLLQGTLMVEYTPQMDRQDSQSCQMGHLLMHGWLQVSGRCALSAGDEAWWKVDIGASVPVSTVSNATHPHALKFECRLPSTTVLGAGIWRGRRQFKRDATSDCVARCCRRKQ